MSPYSLHGGPLPSELRRALARPVASLTGALFAARHLANILQVRATVRPLGAAWSVTIRPNPNPKA